MNVLIKDTSGRPMKRGDQFQPGQVLIHNYDAYLVVDMDERSAHDFCGGYGVPAMRLKDCRMTYFAPDVEFEVAELDNPIVVMRKVIEA